VEQTPSVFANLFVVGLARLRDPIHGDRDFVTVKSRLAEEKPFTLSGTEPNKEGFSIVSIDRSDRVGKSKVTVKKGTEVGVLEFNEMAMQPQAGSGQPGAVNLPGNGVPRPNGAGNSFRPNGIPRPNGSNPQASGIPRPNMGPGAGSQPAPFPARPGGNTQRKIRVINAKP
jgi:hypothetical protein